MSEPVIARRKPFLVDVEAGKTYFWCSCGRSETQPFCDGSHKGTDFEPLKWQATESGEQLFCACKHTKKSPICDGAHNSLSEKYAEAKPEDGADAVLVDYADAEGGASKAMLDGGCYVIRVPEEAMEQHGALKIFPVIGARDGAKHLSQYFAIVGAGDTPVQRYPGSDVALFVVSGHGRVHIADREFAVAPETGDCVKPGEGFRIVADDGSPMVVNITVCPHCVEPEYLDAMPATFDDSVPARAQGVDPAKREPMADRFFQVLLDEKQQRTPVTQFIGEIPPSRAAHHRHLYEETITVLSGEGFLWTDATKAPVRPGDTIFLPRKQHHSLECTTPEGMSLIGVTYPSMSPAINY
jgi:mannose-6-phosphate isomerase-like protein (cupin superfamily)/CDGSH-type Zn-finger protein